MGYDVSLDAQCDWLSLLNDITDTVKGMENVAVYPGHGEPTVSQSDTLKVIAENIAYITYSRGVYVTECNPNVAARAIQNKFPDFDELALLFGFTAPFRVPLDATILGCNCSAVTSCPNAIPPTCNA